MPSISVPRDRQRTARAWRRAVPVLALALTAALAPVAPASAATATSVSLSAARSSITLGEAVRLAGGVSPAQSGRVYLQRFTGGAWRNVASTVLSSSRYAFALRPNSTGSWRMRVLKPAAGGFATGASAARTVTVSARPTVQFGFTSPAVDAGTAPRYTWATTGVPSGYTVRLQRAVGTAAAWRDVETIGASGEREAAAVPQGRHDYRVAVLSPQGSVVSAATARLLSYAPVEMSQLLQRQTETVQINGQLFRYVVSGVDFGGTQTFLTFDSTSCRSYTLNAGKTGKPESIGATLEVVQETADKATLQVRSNEVKQLAGTLTGDAAQFVMTEPGGDDGFVYVNGVFSCWSADGKR